MRWKAKAYVQQVIGALPRPLREPLYYELQRRFGAFRAIEPWSHLREVGEIASAAARHGVPARGATVLDVGTGHRLNIPIAWWLLGARRITTVDVHRYLRADLVRRDLEMMREAPGQVAQALSAHGLEPDTGRLALLRGGLGTTLREILDRISASYLAPAETGHPRVPPPGGGWTSTPPGRSSSTSPRSS